MLNKHYRIGHAVGIAIRLLSDGNVVVNACSVVVNSNLLNIEKRVVDLNDLSDLKKYFPPKSLVSVSLFGKGILQKQVGKLNEIDAGNFSQLLPNANMEDFHIQHFASGENSFVSVIRKSEADKWIQALSDLGYIPLMLSLGPFPVNNIIAQVNNYDGALVFDGHTVQLDSENDWAGYKYIETEKAQFPLKIASNTIDEQLLLPYAVAFQLALSPDIAPIASEVSSIQHSLDNHLNNKRFKVKGFVALIAFFLLLLINFVVFSSLTSSNDEMAATLSISARNVSDQKGIESQIAEKEAILKNLGWDGGLNKSSMVDQLAALLPNDLSLTELSINPIDNNATRVQKSAVFVDRTIKITGNSERIIPVNEWIARIRTLKWVKNAQMDSYLLDRETNIGKFIITINY